MQVNDLLDKLKSRDEARKLDRPVLEHLYLHECEFKDQDFDSLNESFPTVLCHQKPPLVSESSTWVGTGNSASMTQAFTVSLLASAYRHSAC